MIHEAIYDILTNDATVSSLVTLRIYPTLIPLGVSHPSIGFTQVSEYPVSALAADTDILKSRIQFDCVADEFDQAKAVGSAIIDALQRYQGTAASIEIIDIEYENRIDFFDESSDAFRDTLDFSVTYRG